MHEILEKAEVVYHEMPGWQTPTTNARTYYDLPLKAREYVEVSFSNRWTCTLEPVVLTFSSTSRSLWESRYVGAGTHRTTYRFVQVRTHAVY